MLSPNGAVKKSGKIVTMLTFNEGRGKRGMRVGELQTSNFSRPSPVASRSLEQSSRRIDPNHASATVDARHDAIEGDHDGVIGALHVERQALRQLVRLDHRADGLTGHELHAHARQLVDVDLVV